MSVTSWNVNRSPARPPGVSRCVARQADLDLAAAVGRPVAELVAPRAAAAQVASESTPITGAGSCSTSSIGRPTADAERHAGDRFGARD